MAVSGAVQAQTGELALGPAGSTGLWLQVCDTISVSRSHPSRPKERFSGGLPGARRRCQGEDLELSLQKTELFLI